MDYGLNFQVVDKIAEGDLIRLTVLAAELIASLSISAITLSKSNRLVTLNGTDSAVTSEAIASMLLFGIMGILYILTGIVAALYIRVRCKESTMHKVCKRNAARSISTAIGGIFYYIGDNLPPLVEEYAEELNCGPVCVERTQVAGLVMLAIAITTYLPITINAVFTHNKGEDEANVPACVAVFLLLAKITDLDLVYTVGERIIPGTCDESIVGGTWAYYISYFIVFVFVTLCAAVCICKCKETTKFQWVWAVINAFLICTFMACYILADNRLPLGCTGYVRDNRVLRDGLKVALLSVTLIIAFYSIIVFAMWRYSTKHQSNT